VVDFAPFAGFLGGPAFVLTGDQDWAPDWALEAMCEVVTAQDVPLHLFVTNDAPVLRDVPARVTFGIHPNFAVGSSHGRTEDEVIAHCLELVPGASTCRVHRFAESSPILGKLLEHGVVAASHPLSFLQPALVPLIQGTGFLRFPVVLEDDQFLELAQPELDLTLALELLLTPGLKILNFHPVHVALNTPSLDYYARRRAALFSNPCKPCEPYRGRGVATVLRELIAGVKAAGLAFVPFPAVVAEAYAGLARAAPPGGLYDWRPDPVATAQRLAADRRPSARPAKLTQRAPRRGA
jgi:hypothetical protein